MKEKRSGEDRRHVPRFFRDYDTKFMTNVKDERRPTDRRKYKVIIEKERSKKQIISKKQVISKNKKK